MAQPMMTLVGWCSLLRRCQFLFLSQTVILTADSKNHCLESLEKFASQVLGHKIATFVLYTPPPQRGNGATNWWVWLDDAPLWDTSSSCFLSKQSQTLLIRSLNTWSIKAMEFFFLSTTCMNGCAMALPWLDHYHWMFFYSSLRHIHFLLHFQTVIITADKLNQINPAQICIWDESEIFFISMAIKAFLFYSKSLSADKLRASIFIGQEENWQFSTFRGQTRQRC